MGDHKHPGGGSIRKVGHPAACGPSNGTARFVDGFYGYSDRSLETVENRRKPSAGGLGGDIENTSTRDSSGARASHGRVVPRCLTVTSSGVGRGFESLSRSSLRGLLPVAYPLTIDRWKPEYT